MSTPLLQAAEEPKGEGAQEACSAEGEASCPAQDTDNTDSLPDEPGEQSSSEGIASNSEDTSSSAGESDPDSRLPVDEEEGMVKEIVKEEL